MLKEILVAGTNTSQRKKKKNFFRPFGPQFGLKIMGYPGPPGPSPGSATVIQMNSHTA